MRPLTQLNIILQSLEADIQVALTKAWDAYQRAKEAEQHCQHRQPTAPYPTLAPFGECKVCGASATTYRWGQCLTTLYSGNDRKATLASVERQKYDPNFDVGWFPVCAHHASVLDTYGTVRRTSNG